MTSARIILEIRSGGNLTRFERSATGQFAWQEPAEDEMADSLNEISRAAMNALYGPAGEV